jgi:hypothetical protein
VAASRGFIFDWDLVLGIVCSSKKAVPLALPDCMLKRS